MRQLTRKLAAALVSAVPTHRLARRRSAWFSLRLYPGDEIIIVFRFIWFDLCRYHVASLCVWPRLSTLADCPPRQTLSNRLDPHGESVIQCFGDAETVRCELARKLPQAVLKNKV